MSCLLFACQCSRRSFERQKLEYISRARRVNTPLVDHRKIRGRPHRKPYARGRASRQRLCRAGHLPRRVTGSEARRTWRSHPHRPRALPADARVTPAGAPPALRSTRSALLSVSAYESSRRLDAGCAIHRSFEHVRLSLTETGPAPILSSKRVRKRLRRIGDRGAHQRREGPINRASARRADRHADPSGA